MAHSVKIQKRLSPPRTRLSMREKLQHFGAENLTNVELLALILGSGSGAASVLQTATEVFETFSLDILHQQSLTDLKTVSGIGTAKAAQIMAALELGKRNLRPPKLLIKNPEAVLPYVAHIRGKQREHTVCLYLNARHELMHQEIIAVGGLNYSLLEARDVFVPAIRLPAVSVILVHNHPSGTTEASAEDVEVTHKLIEAGKLLGVTLLDHLIVTKHAHASLREQGHIV